ncbi:MAG: Hpt domain-containing protein [Zoogloeaceae bacterium]|jgi:HPt (histidine-containing phosphotransfer) domain-containing protein|nr:Hpt domain-containing protein [Zoogloeaceae bacterium]
MLYDRDLAISMMGDAALFDELTLMFVDDAPGYLAELDSALAAGHFEDLARTAHTLKGLFATFAAEAFRERALDLEMAAKAGDAELCRDLIPQVKENVQALSAAFSAAAQ